MKAIASILLVAAVATAGDYVWYTYGLRHNLVNGLVHGIVLLTAVGLALGAARGRLLRGLPVGALAGAGGALSYYFLTLTLDPRPYGLAIPGAWLFMWLLLAALEGRWVKEPPRAWAGIAVRGFLAAGLGSAAFYLVMEVLWGRPPDGGRNYFVQFLAWAFAWTPGLLALTAGSRAHPDSKRGSVPAGAITVGELDARIRRGDAPAILDVRFPDEFAAGRIPGAVNIPFHLVPFRIEDVPGGAGDDLVVYCGHGPRAHMAGLALRGRRRVLFLTGHWAEWRTRATPSRTGPIN